MTVTLPKPIAAQPEPWERQNGETAIQFSFFRHYRDLPPRERTVEKAAALYSNKKGARGVSIGRHWCADWSWVERAAAWDAEKDRIARLAQIEEVTAMNKRHAQIAMAMIAKAAARLSELAPSDLTASEVRAFFNDAARLERIARGEAETVTATLTPTVFVVDIGTQDQEQP